jgi:hypothetical protein
MISQFKNKSPILLVVILLGSCSRVNENKQTESTNKADNNKFPIEYVGEKILEYNKPMLPPKGGSANPSDTFNIYRLINKSIDTIMVSTLKVDRDTSWYYLKDTSIKTITMGKISYRYLDRKEWVYSSEGNCWGNCDFRVRLSPNQSLSFIMGAKGFSDFDSTKFNIRIKIKKGQKTIDSTVTKRLVLTKNHFVDDTTKWTN